MSDSDRPELPPEQAPGAHQEPAPPQSGAESGPESKKTLLNKFLHKGRSGQAGSKVPSVEHEQSYSPAQASADFEAEMERELQEAMGGLSEKDLFSETLARDRSGQQTGGPKKGKVYRVRGQDVFVELPGGRTQGLLPVEQFSEGPPAPGTEVEVEIEGFDRANGLYILSRKGAVVQADWSSVAEGMLVEARVTETNKGGLSVDVNGIRGFIPVSQIELYRVENLDEYLNQRLRCLVTEVDPVMQNLVLSRRALLEKEREEAREKLWTTLQEGQIFNGLVKTVKDFGAFVDLGGVDGLLHVSELSWSRVNNAQDVLKPGETIKVVITRIDHERRKISLGHRQLNPSPWDDVETKYPVGRIVSGKVSRLADFGAFVELEPAIEGLIHISELASHRVWRVRDVVQEGQEVQVSVLSVDPAQRRISLSLKAALPSTPVAPAEPEPEEELEEKPVKPSRPRTTPLRGGIGEGKGLQIDLPE